MQKFEYHDNLRKEQIQKLTELKKQLPPYAIEYISSKQEADRQISSLIACTRDLLTFFHYLIEENAACSNMTTTSIPASFLGMLRPTDLTDYTVYLTRGNAKGETGHNNMSPSSVDRRRSSLRGLMKYLKLTGEIENNPFDLIPSKKRPKKGSIIHLDADEVSDLVTCVKQASGATKRQVVYREKNNKRDIAIFQLLLNTGIRVSECVGIDLEHIHFKDRCISIIRKGGKGDEVYFNEETEEILNDYIITERDALVKKLNSSSSALFLSYQGKRMSVRAIEMVVKKYAELTFGAGTKISPHKLRATYGTALFQATGDIYTVSKVLGHENMNTSAQYYVAGDEDRKRRAANLQVYKKSDLRDDSEDPTE